MKDYIVLGVIALALIFGILWIMPRPFQEWRERRQDRWEQRQETEPWQYERRWRDRWRRKRTFDDAETGEPIVQMWGENGQRFMREVPATETGSTAISSKAWIRSHMA